MGTSGQGCLTSAANRAIIITLVEEAVASGARQKQACEEIGISERTLQRWCREGAPKADQRPLAKRPAPANKLTDEECKAILDVVNQPEFQSLPPSQIVPLLADQEPISLLNSPCIELCIKPVNNTIEVAANLPPLSQYRHTVQLSRTVFGPGILRICQDRPKDYIFTYILFWISLAVKSLPGRYGQRKRQNMQARRAVMAQNIVQQETPLVLHPDNGRPMKGASMLETLYQLGITPSRSRPRVSNDNLYSESIFRTCKYCPSYPANGFAILNDARIWVKEFVNWYNYNHRHSGIKFLTPHQRHSGQAEDILEKRRQLYEAAKKRHPERWARETRNWSIENEVWLNPEKSPAKDDVKSKTNVS